MMKSLADARILGDIVRFHAASQPDKKALVFDSQSLTYRQLNSRVNQAAHKLLSMNVQPNERVCYLGKNTLCYFELLLALSKVGAVMVPLNWRLSAAELSTIVSDAKTNIVFGTDSFTEVIKEVNSNLDAKSVEWISVDNYQSWLLEQSDVEPPKFAHYESDVLQLYTSGTTGAPKGVRISNRALLSGRARESHPLTPEWNKWSGDDVSLIAMPCFHIGGTGFGLNTLYAGATGIIVRQFVADQQLDVMVEYGVTKLFIVPSALRTVLDDPRLLTVDLSALKFITYGASPIPMDLMKECIDAFGCGFVQKYGMTETSGTCVALGPEDHTIPENPKMKSVGKPLAGVEIKITDESGKKLAPGRIGEIVIKSDTNMSGYWQNEEATRSASYPDGWLRTGDAGYIDELGYLYIQDRIKDMIVSGGENVYSAEVEAALKQNTMIADVAVIGVPDHKWGEAVKACVVLKPGRVTDEAAIIADCRKRIAAYKTPKTVDFLKQLPRNASGKILKTKLRSTYWINRDKRVN